MTTGTPHGQLSSNSGATLRKRLGTGLAAAFLSASLAGCFASASGPIASAAPDSTSPVGPGAVSGVSPSAPTQTDAPPAVTVSPSAAPTSPPVAPSNVPAPAVAVKPVPAPAVVAAAFVASRVRLSLVRVAQGLNSPLFVTHAPGSSRLFIVEQGGQIRILSSGTLLSTPFLDISSRISTGGELGLLGLAFHPQYATNHKFYIDYTDLNGDTIIAEYTAASATRARTTGRTLLKIAQPYPNHKGGMLAFGRDGYLYIGMGDGGSAGDPGNRAQSVASLLGKLLRIDVNHRTGRLAYGIPRTNPYVGRAGLDQIWSRGLRNPWRFSFDRSTGDLWIGDVGQDRYEEIDRALRSSGGGRGVNFGWRVLEGRACYNPSSGCSTSGKQGPLTTYSHSYGCAVTGGYVYRGTRYPVLVGGYLFADFCSGRIWSLVANGRSSQTPQLLLSSGHSISSFGEGNDGSLYLCDLASGEVFLITATRR